MKSARALKAVLLGASALVIPAPGWAQQAPPSAGVTVSPVEASLSLGAVYTDNLFATENRKVDDFIAVIKPSLGISLAGERGKLDLKARGEVGRHGDYASEDYEDWLIGGDGRLRLNGDVSAIGGAEYAWEHESRASPEATSGLSPTEYERAHGYAGLLFNRDRLRARVAASASQFDYSDVPTATGTINNDDRDHTRSEIGGRAGFVTDGGREYFVQGGLDRRDYENAADDLGYRRDSDGYFLGVGMRREAGKSLRGEAFIGTMNQDYDDPRLEDVSTFDVGAAVDWTGPSGLTGRLRLDRTIEETTLPGASGYVLTAGSAGLESAVHPRLSVGAGLSASQYDYQGSPRSELVAGANVWGRYWVSRRNFVGLDYSLAQRTSNAAGYDYEENRIQVSFGSQLRPAFTGGFPALPAFDDRAPGGFYAAVLAGHGSVTTGLDGPRGPGTNTADFGDFGASYGAAAGYGWLMGPLYVGVEIDAQGDGPSWTHTADREFSVERLDSFGASGRLGYVTGGALIYGRVGLTATKFRTVYLHSNHAFYDSDRETGVGLGFGLETAGRGFVRAEYGLTSYDDYDVPTGGGNFDNFANAETLFRVGGGIRFGQAQAQGPAVDFSGFYGGVSVGHGALSSFNMGERSGGTELSVDRSSDGPSLGVLAGYGLVYQRFYLGAELDADWTDIDWNIERDPNGRTYSAEHRISGAATVRLGRLVGPRSLVYVSGGPVRTRFAVDYATSGTAVTLEPIRNGMRLGGGLETALSSNYRLRLEYAVTEYDAYDVAYGLESDSFDNSESTVRLGVIRRF